MDLCWLSTAMQKKKGGAHKSDKLMWYLSMCMDLIVRHSSLTISCGQCHVSYSAEENLAHLWFNAYTQQCKIFVSFLMFNVYVLSVEFASYCEPDFKARFPLKQLCL